LELARNAGEQTNLDDALSQYAYWLFRMNQIDEAKKYVDESERLFKEIGAKQSLNPFLFAELAWNNGDYQQAKSIYLELHQRFSLLGEKGFRSSSAGKLGLLAMEEGDLAQAQVYLEEALLIEREAGWNPWVAFYLTELGNLFYRQESWKSSSNILRKSFFESYFSSEKPLF
jgi:tetratricopeptide (TPR) repeat protein